MCHRLPALVLDVKTGTAEHTFYDDRILGEMMKQATGATRYIVFRTKKKPQGALGLPHSASYRQMHIRNNSLDY